MKRSEIALSRWNSRIAFAEYLSSFQLLLLKSSLSHQKKIVNSVIHTKDRVSSDEKRMSVK